MAERLVARGRLQLDKMTETIGAFALGSAASVHVATPPTSTEPLLAVLPFDNLSDDREMQFFKAECEKVRVVPIHEFRF